MFLQHRLHVELHLNSLSQLDVFFDKVYVSLQNIWEIMCDRVTNLSLVCVLLYSCGYSAWSGAIVY